MHVHHLYRPANIAPDEAAWLLVLLHGVGSNEADLFSLAPAVPAPFHVVSLRAPFAMGPDSHAWFAFDVLPDGGRRIDVAQEATSRELLGQVLDQLQAALAVPPERTVLGGFSQGGIMAMSLLLTEPQRMGAAMALHSRLLPEVSERMAAPEALAGHALWVSHGLQDDVIPIAQARATRDFVRDLPLALSYHEFNGQHDIPSMNCKPPWRGWMD